MNLGSFAEISALKGNMQKTRLLMWKVEVMKHSKMFKSSIKYFIKLDCNCQNASLVIRKESLSSLNTFVICDIENSSTVNFYIYFLEVGESFHT